MNSTAENNFIETLEYRRFAEFCDACRHCQYIGLCYGSPGVGKTLSARRYSLWDRIQGVKLSDLPEGELQELARVDALLYTTPAVNTPREIERDIPKLRDLLRDFRQEPIRREETRRLKQIQKRDADHRDSFFSDYDWFSEKLPTLKPTFGQVCRKYSDKQRAIGDPTRLILMDEADRLKMGSLEQMRSIFDAGGIGLVLIGMPGIEKRLARYPQFYSRIGFVHEFRTLSPEQVRELLALRWRPAGLTRSNKAALDAERMFEKSSAGDRSSSRDANYHQYRQALPYRSDRCSLGADRADVTGSRTRWPTTHNQHSRCVKRNLLSSTNRLPMAFASPRVSSLEHRLSLLPTLEERWCLDLRPALNVPASPVGPPVRRSSSWMASR